MGKIIKSILIVSKAFLNLLFFLILNTSLAVEGTQTGMLKLSILDSESGEAVPARVEVLDSDGTSYSAEDALLIGGTCGEVKDGKWGPTTYDGASVDNALDKFTTIIKTPFEEKFHFYSTGKSTLKLPLGNYRIRVFKGPEYEVSHAEAMVESSKITKKSILLSRFVNMPAKGWYSADDHLHIARINKGVDPLILKMMQAEDIHVGNLLQMGRADTNLTTLQYAHGEKSRYQDGSYIISSGQENLRTDLLGHTITLGAENPIYMPEKYLLYRLAWQQAADEGGLNGYAHFGEVRLGLESGLPVLAPHNLMHFIEVLQFNRARYSAWYNLLNLGFRITPTAGTDYPCVRVFPGQERFFTKVDGPLTFESWLDGVRTGKTFVTNGPLLEFSVNGQDIGSDVVLPGESEVLIKGEVRFQKGSPDLMMELELVENGEVIRKFPRLDDSGKISFEISQNISETSWLALRTNSRFINGTPSLRHFDIAHTAPIYVTLKNKPPIMEHPRTRVIARKWLASLDALKVRLSTGSLTYLHEVEARIGRTDPLPRQVLMDNSSALIGDINSAEKFFEKFLKNSFVDESNNDNSIE